MAILNRVKRIDIGGGDWIEVTPLNNGETRDWLAEAQAHEEDGAYNLELLSKACARIVAWSDPEPPTEANLARVPIEISALVLHALMDVEIIPLAPGSASTATLRETPAE